MIVTIHQPEHLPYLGLIDKISNAQTLVFLDSVDFEKNYFQNRNRIYTKEGEEFITIPVTNKGGKIKDVEISKEFFKSVRRKNINKIQQSYSKHPYFDDFFPKFNEIYSNDYKYLSELNIDIFKLVFEYLGINVNVIKSSELEVQGNKTDLLVDICKKVKATKYIAGKSGEDYLDIEKFSIPVEIQHFKHPVYTQYGKTEFKPYMCVLDGIFNVGKELMNIIKIAQR